MKIHVGAFELDDGDLRDPEKNPIALALWAHTGERWRVEEAQAIRLDPVMEDCTVPLPWRATWALDWLSKGGTVDPFAFDFPIGPDLYTEEPSRWLRHEAEPMFPSPSEPLLESLVSTTKTSS